MYSSMDLYNKALLPLHEQELIDVLEEAFVLAHWKVKRPQKHELLINVTSAFEFPYYAQLCWLENHSFLSLAVTIGLPVDANRRHEVDALLSLINTKLHFGHFEVDERQQIVVFRHTQYTTQDMPYAIELIENMIYMAAESCNRYYGSFLLCLHENVDAQGALKRGSSDVDGNA